MATDKQKEELAEVLKFTPCDYTFSISGWGGEIVVGEVEQKVIDYFDANEISIDEYASGDDSIEVPEEFQPFEPGAWHECDNIAHGYGAFASNSTITVYDDNGDVVWEHDTDEDELAEFGITVGESDASVDLDSEKYANQLYYIGTSEEKGSLYVGTIALHAPFDPLKLKFAIQRVAGWDIISEVTYDGVAIENTDMDTSGKSSSHEFLET
jgi:hypothetical protein